MSENATLLQVRNFFGMSTSEFRSEWMELDTESRQQITKGIGDGSLTY